MPELANESNSYPDVSPEWVVQIDPDVILQSEPSTKNYTEDELSQLRDEIMSRPELQSVKAVEDGRVFVMSGKITSGIRAIVGELYDYGRRRPECGRAPGSQSRRSSAVSYPHAKPCIGGRECLPHPAAVSHPLLVEALPLLLSFTKRPSSVS